MSDKDTLLPPMTSPNCYKPIGCTTDLFTVRGWDNKVFCFSCAPRGKDWDNPNADRWKREISTDKYNLPSPVYFHILLNLF